MTFKRIVPNEMKPGDHFFAQQGNQTRYQGCLVEWIAERYGRVINKNGSKYGHPFISDTYMVSCDITQEEIERTGQYGQLVDETGADIPFLF